MKIAIATLDGETLAPTPGDARIFVIAEMENGQVVRLEAREMPTDIEQHGPQRRKAVLNTVKDCQVFVARGMGQPIYETLRNMGMKVFATEARTVNEVLERYKLGTLAHHPQRVHEPHHHHGHHHGHEHHH